MSLEIYLILIKIFNPVLIQLLAWEVRVLHINGYMFLHIQVPSRELWEIELACPQGREFSPLSGGPQGVDMSWKKRPSKKVSSVE